MVHSTPVSLVTVVFEAELGLLRLQARSIARHVPPELVDRVLVIDNGWHGISRRRQHALRASYGALADRVEFLRASSVTETHSAGGWTGQQILKLAIARRLSAPSYLVLDAKNHFVAPLTTDDLFDQDGRPRVDVYPFRDHPHRHRLEHVLTYLRVDPEPYLDRFTSTVTPYLLQTDHVLDLMAGVSARAGRPFEEEFVRADLTEFFLYAGWTLASGRSLDQDFCLQQSVGQTVWASQVQPEQVAVCIANSKAGGSPVFSVHRDAWARLPRPSRELIADYWVSRGLFDSADQSRAVVDYLCRSVRRATVDKAITRVIRDAGRPMGLR